MRSLNIGFIIGIILIAALANAESKQALVNQIRVAAAVGGVDPDIAVAIATVESGLNPKAVGALGEVGLFQLRPEYHAVAKGNTNQNILLGVSYLGFLKDKFGARYPNAWFVLYNYGPSAKLVRHPNTSDYYRKVMREVNRLRVQKYFDVAVSGGGL